MKARGVPYFFCKMGEIGLYSTLRNTQMFARLIRYR